MVSVIIPTLNEQETIGQVIAYALSHSYVSEVLVIDDKSKDDTTVIAREAGAKVYNSTQLGKGASMLDGLMLAQNEWLVFLDGDIHPYPAGMLDMLVAPLRNDEYDFVKSCFNRNAGRVTELVAKPLLGIFFPELAQFHQPLSGMIAGKKSVLQQLHIPNDYGVDISILIDLFMQGFRITQVEIGYIENKSRPLNQIGKMSKEVSAAILKKAIDYSKTMNLEDLSDFEQITEQLRYSVRDSISHLQKMVILDMDDTILQGRFIYKAAGYYNFEKELLRLRKDFEGDPVMLTKSIARLMKGKPYNEIIEIADSIPLVEDSCQVVQTLKSRGYIVGIISDSYTAVTEHVKHTIGADFSLANELVFSDGKCTGEVHLPSFFFKNEKSVCMHNICKSNAMVEIAKQYNIPLKNIIAVGDSRNDLCMISSSGVGVAFCSKDDILNEYADVKISSPSFERLLSIG